jgi:hypothetical protein
MKRNVAPLLALVISGAFAIACSPAATASPASPAATAATAEIAPAVAATREIYVYKSPTCTCCHEWESYLISKGYTVRSMPTDNMSELKAQMKVPEAAWSCHTAVIDGYVVEGHVPVEAIDDLLASRPGIDGIALPGMPAGSPGMPGVKVAPFDVLALSDGDTSSFGAY